MVSGDTASVSDAIVSDAIVQGNRGDVLMRLQCTTSPP
jgi:hypothetical protein